MHEFLKLKTKEAGKQISALLASKNWFLFMVTWTGKERSVRKLISSLWLLSRAAAARNYLQPTDENLRFFLMTHDELDKKKLTGNSFTKSGFYCITFVLFRPQRHFAGIT